MRQWTGRETRMLRQAQRRSVRQFAGDLQVSERVVSYWEAAGARCIPRQHAQRALDTALEQATHDALARFTEALGDTARALSTAGMPAPATDDRIIVTPPLEPTMVIRENEYEALIALLTADPDPSRPPACVAVAGPGGFGKTTLATQATHDARVRDAFAHVLWVEAGEHCTPQRITELIGDLCVHLGAPRPSFADPDQAGLHLAQLLAGRRVLIVVDNVWSATDLGPFLLGGDHRCVLLVTTRNLRTCPASAVPLRVGPMSTPQISELLRRATRHLDATAADQLALASGGWALLASILGSTVDQDIDAGAPPEQAVTNAVVTLRTEGPHAWDLADADQRRIAIGHAIQASLDSLTSSVVIPGLPDLHDRYLDLAVFSPATAIPLRVLKTWWKHTHGTPPAAVQQFCRILADRSLTAGYLADHDEIILHDVFRRYLRRLRAADDWTTAHRTLIGAYRPATSAGWGDLDTAHLYMWRYLSYHLREAGSADEVVAALADPRYVVGKAARCGADTLATDHAILRTITTGRPTSAGLTAALTLTARPHLLSGMRRTTDIAATLQATAVTAGQPTLAAALGQFTTDNPYRFTATWWQAAAVADGHCGAVTAVATAGDLIASAGEDGTIRLWSRSERKLVRVLTGHTGWVHTVAFAPSATVLASAGEDTVIRLWDAPTGEPAGALAGHTRRIRSLTYTRDGQLLSGGEDGTVIAWDTASRRPIRTMQTPAVPVWSVAVSPDGTTVCATGEDEFVRLYHLDTGTLAAEYPAHRDWIRSAAFMADPPRLVTGSSDETLATWSLDGPHPALSQRTLVAPTRIRAITAGPDRGVVACAGEDAVIRVFHDGEPAAQAAMPPGVDWIRSIALTEAGTVIAGCEDGAVRAWHPTTPDVELIAAGASATWSAAYTGDGRTLLRGSSEGTVTSHDVDTGHLTGTRRVGPGRVWALTAADRQVAAACGDGTIHTWSTDAPDTVLHLNTDQRRTWSVALNGDGTLLAAGAAGLVRVWRLPHPEPLLELHAHQGRIRSIAFDRTGRRLVTGGGDGAVRLWSVPDGALIHEHLQPHAWIRAVTLSPHGDRIAAGYGPGHIDLITPGTNATTTLHGHSSRVLHLAFTSTGQLVSAAADGTLRRWDTETGNLLASIRLDASLHTAAFDDQTGNAVAASAKGVTAVVTRHHEGN